MYRLHLVLKVAWKLLGTRSMNHALISSEAEVFIAFDICFNESAFHA